MSEELTDYQKYRGKCKEMSEELVAKDPTLTLVRGFYVDWLRGEEQHWWCTKPDGTIIDPTALQFPSKGSGEYIPFDGYIECSYCSKRVKEEEATIDGRYAFCSYECRVYFCL